MPNCAFPFLRSVISERGFANLVALIMLILVIQILVFNVLVNTKIVKWLQIDSSVFMNHRNLKW